MKSVQITAILALLVLPTTTRAEVYLRCVNEKGESRVVQHVEFLPEAEWTCEKTEIAKVVGQKDPELETPVDAGTLVSQETDPSGSEAESRSHIKPDPLTADSLRKDIEEFDLKEFENAEEKEEFVTLCGSGDHGRECSEAVRKVMQRIAERKKR